MLTVQAIFGKKPLVQDTEEICNTKSNKNVTSRTNVQIGDEQYEVLVDTGSTISVIREETVQLLRARKVNVPELPVVNMTVRGATGKPAKVRKQVMPHLAIGDQEMPAVFYVVPNLITQIILGMDWLTDHATQIDLPGSVLRFSYNGKDVILPLIRSEENEESEIQHIKYQLDDTTPEEQVVKQKAVLKNQDVAEFQRLLDEANKEKKN